VGRYSAVLRDARCWVWACRHHHDQLDKERSLRVPRHALPPGVEGFAQEHGLGWWLDREYGMAQTDLFAREPALTLSVPAGWTSWWGVDASTKALAIAMVSSDGERFGLMEAIPSKLDGAPRLDAIYRATLKLCDDTVLTNPGVVAVEAPSGFGDRPNPELAYAVGAVLAALASALPQARIELVASAAWKKQVCGYGAIRKPKPTSKESYLVLTWAQMHGYQGSSWDMADAWAIAEYAHSMYALAERD
jgi:hypothetical protein